MLTIIKGYLRHLYWRLGLVNSKFPGTKNYWRNHYKNGGSSGPGSYNNLAEFKANVINDFIRKNDIRTVIDLGCGDGNQLSLFEVHQYIGFDITAEAINICQKKFKDDTTKSFYLYDETFSKKLDIIGKADLAISLDVIFHLIEDHLFNKYMDDLFLASKRYIIIYSSNYESRQIFHEKNRNFMEWISVNRQEWKHIGTVKNLYPFERNALNNTSESDFYFFGKN